MPTKPLLSDPTNRIVAIFDERAQADAARRVIAERGVAEGQIRILQGEQLADQVDTSAKWFADTDEEIARYERALRAGKTVISLPVGDQPSRDSLHRILKQHEARIITHFGQWVTEMLK
jgi:hypothetical protein